MRDRNLLLQQDGRIYGRALRLYHRALRAHPRRSQPQQDVGAAAVFSEEGENQIKANLDYYRNNAKIIADCMDRLGIWYTGGKHSPYIWLRCPNGMDSWAFFDLLLEKANVVGTPGSGFGKNGEGYFRLTAFGTEENTREACRRLEALLSSLQ